MLLVIVAIIFVVVVIIQFVHAKKPIKQVVQLKSGSVGSGKSYLTVRSLIKDYRKLNLKYKLRKTPLRLIKGLTIDAPPRIYSNIPIYISRKKGFSYVLKREHLLLQENLPDDVSPLVLIDEVGLLASQYSYKDHNIISDNVNDFYQCLEVFIRFYRHFYGESNSDGCRLYLTDQATGGVCINIRRRLGVIDYLNNFHRWLGFTPFFKVDVRTMLLAEDTTQNVNDTQNSTLPTKDGGLDYYFGYLPYKWLPSKRHYDSHCYSGCKDSGFVSKVAFDNWYANDYFYTTEKGKVIMDVMKTNYCPDLRMTMEELADYKQLIKSHGLDRKDLPTY